MAQCFVACQISIYIKKIPIYRAREISPMRSIDNTHRQRSSKTRKKNLGITFESAFDKRAASVNLTGFWQGNFVSAWKAKGRSIIMERHGVLPYLTGKAPPDRELPAAGELWGGFDDAPDSWTRRMAGDSAKLHLTNHDRRHARTSAPHSEYRLKHAQITLTHWSVTRVHWAPALHSSKALSFVYFNGLMSQNVT